MSSDIMPGSWAEVMHAGTSGYLAGTTGSHLAYLLAWSWTASLLGFTLMSPVLETNEVSFP